MSRRRPRFFDHGTPRGLTAFEAAGYLGLGESEFGAMLPRLLKAGFPIRDPITNRFDREAIDCWLDRRSGLAVDCAVGDWRANLRAFAQTDPQGEERGGKREGAASRRAA